MDNHTFHREFVAHVETLETYSGVGVVSVVPTFLTARIKELAADGLIANPANPTDAKCALAVSSVWDEFLAALMLSEQIASILVLSGLISRISMGTVKIVTPRPLTTAFLFLITGNPSKSCRR